MTWYSDFEVTLLGAEPPVWRRFLIRPNATFMDLHEAIQHACGWQNSHLFVFRDSGGGAIAGLPDDEGFDEPDPDAAFIKLSSFFQPDAVETCAYEYDFGDSWEHSVVLKGTVDLEESFERRLIDGGRAFPLEDSGGLRGYEDCVKAVQGFGQTKFGSASEAREWLGDWDPEIFDLASAKRIFDR